MTTSELRQIDISPLIGSKLKVAIDVPPELQFLEDGQQVAAGRHCFRIMHPDKGDERLTWDCTSLGEIQQAKKLFIELVKQGLTPYRVGTNGKATAEVMREFDPHAEEVIFMPTAKLVAGG